MRSFNRADNLQNHMNNCTCHGVVTTVAAATTVPAPAVDPRLQFKLQKTCEASLEVNVQLFTVNMKEAQSL